MTPRPVRKLAQYFFLVPTFDGMAQTAFVFCLGSLGLEKLCKWRKTSSVYVRENEVYFLSIQQGRDFEKGA